MDKRFLTSLISLAAGGGAFAAPQLTLEQGDVDAGMFRAHEIQIDAYGSYSRGNVDWHWETVTRFQAVTVMSATASTTSMMIAPAAPTAPTAPTTPTAGTAPATPAAPTAPAASTAPTSSSAPAPAQGVTTTKTVTSQIKVRNHNALGGGVGVNYFLTRNFGVGVEGDWLAGDSVISEAALSLIYRFPMEQAKPYNLGLAPYVFAGGGGQFGDQNVIFGQIGAGAELRFRRNFGAFLDGRWVVHDSDINYGLFRLGARVIF